MLTERQQAIYDFILEFRGRQGCSPSIPEIQDQFGIRSPNGVVGHLSALEQKGYIRRAERGSRQIDITGPNGAARAPLVDLPVHGTIPAGSPDGTVGGGEGMVTVDCATLGFRPGQGAFALRVRGDSMRDAGILDGDMVVVEPAQAPREAQIVAALIDGECTLKRLVRQNGKWYLKAENPAYPELHPQ
ncbi:MAG: transcriptional repressor LexA, partial [Bryobacteraceae bacterium]|nr:transcriptional repressor LexA [Bryobacteraceae bacterium]